ncbi:MAG: tyrosine-type recombinase/integrase, partial [bacterium]
MKTNQPIVEYILPFLDYCEIEKGLSNNTQRNYKQYLKLFIDWLKITNRKNLLPNELTSDHIWDYRLYLARSYKTHSGEYLGKKSQNYYLIAVRALLDFLADRDIDTLPSSKVKLAKQKTDETISFLEVRDIEAMLMIPDIKISIGIRDRAIMELFFSSGMRISELVALNADQMSFLKDKNPKRTFELSIVGKGKRVRTIFISPRAAEWLRIYLSSRKDVQKPLFINHRGKDIDDDHRLTPRSIQKMISRCSMLAGI